MVRLANYANFSPEMTSQPGFNPLTVEYFCFRGDDTWDAPDHTMVERAKLELAHMKILEPDRVISGFVVRSEKAYPVIEIATRIRSPQSSDG